MGDISGILGDGVLDQDTVDTVLNSIAMDSEHAARPFLTPRTFKLMGMPEIFPADGGVSIEEVSGAISDSNPPTNS